jgi:hypothetical protein
MSFFTKSTQIGPASISDAEKLHGDFVRLIGNRSLTKDDLLVVTGSICEHNHGNIRIKPEIHIFNAARNERGRQIKVDNPCNDGSRRFYILNAEFNADSGNTKIKRTKSVNDRQQVIVREVNRSASNYGINSNNVPSRVGGTRKVKSKKGLKNMKSHRKTKKQI